MLTSVLRATVARAAPLRLACDAAARTTRVLPGASAATRRAMSGASAPAAPTEASLRTLLSNKLEATHVTVQDVSGGCGAFFQVVVVSPRFTGLSMIKQHQAVNAAIEAEIGKMHGLTLKTYTPASWEALVAATKAA